MTTTTSPSALQMIEAFRNTPAMDLNHLSRGEAEQLNRRCLALEAENDELRVDVEELLEEKKEIWEEVEEKVYRECTKADEDFKQKEEKNGKRRERSWRERGRVTNTSEREERVGG